MSKNDNYNRIAKNTIMLYLRMFFTVLVGLYTSRVVINVLGVSDYGLYNVVGGILSMVSFINTAMIVSSQRFITYELGKGEKARSNEVFCTSVNIHITIAIIIFVLAEFLGVWFLNNHINMEPNRIVAANWVFQCSLISFMMGIISVPFTSHIVAHEKMGVYAYGSIVSTTLKLIIVYLLLIINYDKLIVYAILTVIVSVTMSIFYVLYCYRKFKECRYRFYMDRQIFKAMFSFAGWSFFGNMGYSLNNQLSNIILNIFFGTTINAARGIAGTVNNIVTSFATNFTMAMNPQITKQYSAGNISESQRIVYEGARLSFYLMSIISIPLIINVDYVLKLWLGLVPTYSSVFLFIILMSSLLYTLSQPITVAIQATGKIACFQIGICIIMLSEIPIAYVILKCGGKPYDAMAVDVIISFVALVFRFIVLKKLVPSYSVRYYFLDVVLKCIVVFVLCLSVSYVIRMQFDNGFLVLIVSSLISLIISIPLIYLLGINKMERVFVKQKMVLVYKKVIESLKTE